MKKHIYYHIYLTDDLSKWVPIFIEQFKLMEDFGLLDAADTVNVTAIHNPNSSSLKTLIDFLHSYDTKNHIKITPFANDRRSQMDDATLFSNVNNRENTLTENITMRKIYNDAAKYDEGDAILYIHSKGITSIDNHLINGNADMFKKYFYWRQFLNYGVVEKWKECVEAIEKDYDIAGVNYFEDPHPHFSGTFWWSKVSHIRKLPNPESLEWWHQIQRETEDNWLKTAPDRFRDEMWICSVITSKVFIPVENKKRYLSAELLTRNEYT